MESDDINNSNGEFHNFCVRFKTADFSNDFATSYRDGVKNNDQKSDVIFIQPESNIPNVATSPDPSSPDVPIPRPTFSFGGETSTAPALTPSFGGFTFGTPAAPAVENTGAFNFGTPKPSNNGGFNFGN